MLSHCVPFFLPPAVSILASASCTTIMAGNSRESPILISSSDDDMPVEITPPSNSPRRHKVQQPDKSQASLVYGSSHTLVASQPQLQSELQVPDIIMLSDSEEGEITEERPVVQDNRFASVLNGLDEGSASSIPVPSGSKHEGKTSKLPFCSFHARLKGMLTRRSRRTNSSTGNQSEAQAYTERWTPEAQRNVRVGGQRT